MNKHSIKYWPNPKSIKITHKNKKFIYVKTVLVGIKFSVKLPGILWYESLSLLYKTNEIINFACFCMNNVWNDSCRCFVRGFIGLYNKLVKHVRSFCFFFFLRFLFLLSFFIQSFISWITLIFPIIQKFWYCYTPVIARN